MPQNETQELAALSEGIAGLLRRRRGLGLRRTAAIPDAPPPATVNRPEKAPYAPPAAIETPLTPAPAPAPTKQAGYTPPTAAPAKVTAAASQTPAAPAAHSGAAPAASLAPDVSGYRSLEELAQGASACRACGLARTRNHVFVGYGSGTSGVLFIDEMPGAPADAGGSPFEGPSGELLGNIVTKGMGLPVDAVQLISLVKCQPRAGTPPEPSELSTCRGWLDRQLELLAPKVIVTLGRPAAAAILGMDEPLGRLRGKVHTASGRQVVATFHPEYLVRSPQYKKQAWEDIQLAMGVANVSLPTRK